MINSTLHYHLQFKFYDVVMLFLMRDSGKILVKNSSVEILTNYHDIFEHQFNLNIDYCIKILFVSVCHFSIISIIELHDKYS